MTAWAGITLAVICGTCTPNYGPITNAGLSSIPTRPQLAIPGKTPVKDLFKWVEQVNNALRDGDWVQGVDKPEYTQSGRNTKWPNGSDPTLALNGFRCSVNSTTDTSLDVSEGYGQFEIEDVTGDLSGTITGFSTNGTAWAYLKYVPSTDTWSLNRLDGSTKPAPDTDELITILSKVTVSGGGDNRDRTVVVWHGGLPFPPLIGT